MQALGTRHVPPDTTLEERMKARLHDELDREAGAGRGVVTDRGLGLFDETGADGTCILTVDDVVRICAQEARRWF
ncbi:hypothetical protein [Paractinoplanes atraurantiacus]|uniref:Uncharacterized protein n=1 Tax=Paractinoplanes atraurantiacus TaxID=1036182 RepID=A0A285H070_9ACTN|nr:hypothetical protein [Actinoplanes atraurantiacus]SNY29145.1 hypothetical protein SAMN05421748_103199 [Actinoplanes atraurantiacus]